MKIIQTFFQCIIILILSVSCANSQDSKLVIPKGNPKVPTKTEAVATFGEGCFWHSEIVFQSILGVRDAVSGYSGGSTKNPTYSDVCTGSTGHAEVVQVYYDPEVVSFRTLVQAFFDSVDPTQLNRQGNDRGTQYRSVIFYRTEEERKIALDEIEKIKALGKYKSPIVTEVKPFTVFYPAEEYHQEYILNHPENPYVEGVSIPDYQEFRKRFHGKLK